MADLAELRKKVAAFRKTELQILLAHAGQSKLGRKQEVCQRAMALLDNDPSPSVRMKINELFRKRFPSVPSTDSNSKTVSSAPALPVLSSPTTSSSVFEAITSSASAKGIIGQTNEVFTPLLPSSHSLNSQVPWLPVHPDVRLKPLPFYDVQGELLKPSSLVPLMNTSRYQENTFTFHLTPQQTKLINSSMRVVNYEQIYGTQVQLRFCLLETSCEQEDCFPSGICVKVNGKMATLPNPIPTNKLGVEPKRPGRPVNITHQCKILATAANQIVVSWNSDPSRNFCVSVYIVDQLNSSILLDRLKKFGMRHADHTRGLIKEKMMQDPDSEIATTSLRVSLVCPVGKVKMSVPCRPSSCKHVQCFDAATFLQMNEKKPTWTCAVCDKPAEFKTLVIDGLLTEILRQCPDANEIQFSEDGQYKAISEKASKSSSSASKPVKMETVIESPEKPLAAEAALPAASASSSKSKDIIDLTETDSDVDDDEKEERADNDFTRDISFSSSSPMSVLSTDSNEHSSGEMTSNNSNAELINSTSKVATSFSGMFSGKSSSALGGGNSLHVASLPTVIDSLSPLSVATLDSPASVVSIRSPASPLTHHSPGSRNNSQHAIGSRHRSPPPPLLYPEPLALVSPSKRVSSATSMSGSFNNHLMPPPPPAHQHHSNHNHRHHSTPSARVSPYPAPTYRSTNFDSINWSTISNQDYYDLLSSVMIPAPSDGGTGSSSRLPITTAESVTSRGQGSATNVSAGLSALSGRSTSSSSLLGFPGSMFEPPVLSSAAQSSAVTLPSSLLWPIPPPLGGSWSQSGENNAQSSVSAAAAAQILADPSLDFFFEDYLNSLS